MNIKKIAHYLQQHPLFTDLLCLGILAIPTIIALLNSQYFSMHDDQHIARLFVFDKAFREGEMYPRWVDLLGFGYGYPLFNFYPPLIYFVAEFFHLIGFSFIWSIKLMIMVGFVTAAYGMYFYAKSLFNRWSGILAAVLYTYFTYHAVTVYVRGALAEFFALSILPFLFLAFRNLAHKRSIKNILLFGVAFAVLIITHPLIALPAVIYIGAFGLFYMWQTPFAQRRDFLIKSAAGGILGLGLAAFFWLPSIIEKQFTLVDDILTTELANYKIHFVCAQQLWYSAWGYGGSGAGCTDGMTFQLGKIHIAFLVAFVIGGLYLTLRKRLQPIIRQELLFLIALLGFSIFMMLDYSKGFWDALSFLWYLQFPWRFLTFVAVFISLLGGGTVYVISKAHSMERFEERISMGIVGIGIVLCVFTYGKYFMPQEQRNVNDTVMTSKEEVSWRISRSSFEFIPKGVRTVKSDLNTTIPAIEKETLPTESFQLVSGRGIVEPYELKSTMKSFIVKQDIPVVFQLNTFNFPGWEATLTNSFNTVAVTSIPISDDNPRKLIRVNLPQGEYILSFTFKDTATRIVANMLTLMSFLVIGLYMFRKNPGVARFIRFGRDKYKHLLMKSV